MALPKSIEERGARADEMMQKAAGTPAPQAPPQTQQQAPETPPAAPPAPPAPAPTPAFEASWEQRFKVLQGKYNAEVPALHEQVKQLRTELQTARETVAQAQAAPAAPDLSALTPEEREQYGEDFLKVVAKVAAGQRPAAAPAQDLSQVNQRLDQLQSVVAESKEDEFFRLLDTRVAGWEKLNTDPGFLEWLAGTDELSGITRQQMFTDAYNRLNVDRIAKFFTSYPGATQSSGSSGNSATSLDAQVVPSVNHSNPPPPPGKKVWQAREIANFYVDVRRGVFKGREAEMSQIEQDIFAAQADGRVR